MKFITTAKKAAFPSGFLFHLKLANRALLPPLVCLSWVVAVSHIFVEAASSPLLLASMGAAAVLMFSAPHSPMATYRAFLLGNLISAGIGVSCYQLFGSTPCIGALAVAIAIWIMHLLKCVHPPGGATALIAVIGGPSIHSLGYWYIVSPVLLNISLFACIVWIHRKKLKNS